MFKKKIDIEILNIFNKIENKIDNINHKFDSITYLDGCCQCKERESKINEMFINFFESKLTELQHSFQNSDDTFLSEFKETLKKELENIKNPIDNKSLLEQLKDISNKIDSNTKYTKDIYINTEKLNVNTKDICNDIFSELFNKNDNQRDKQLRFDLNTLLVNLKDEIKNEVKQSLQITLTNQNKSIEQILTLKELAVNLSSKTDSFFYDNEIIKHQFILEENIRVSNDSIDALKLSIEKTINEINLTFNKFDFTE